MKSCGNSRGFWRAAGSRGLGECADFYDLLNHSPGIPFRRAGRQTDPSAFEMPVLAPRLIYSAAAVQGWYLLHWLEVTRLAECGAIFAKVLDRLASGALRLPPAKRHRPQNIADALRDADGAPREGKPLLDLSSWAAD
jgi:hypothetical protein